jgi:hypothetical protein
MTVAIVSNWRVLIKQIHVGFEVLTVVDMKSSIFCNITPCSPLKVSRRFGGTCRLHLQGLRISQVKNQHEPCSKLCYGESGGITPPFLTSALDGGEWSLSCPCLFTPGERASGTHRIGGWVGPRAGIAAMEWIKISYPCRESNLVRPARSYTD